jgi:predicted MFS family arabinose efflux permease
MASELIGSAIKLRGFLATPCYLRLWFAGGVGNAMRWFELLVAGIFTYEVTQSTILVALVTVARSLPMLFIGTIAGVVGEALNRKRLLVTQLFVMAVSSATLCALAFSAQIRVWHIAVGGIVAGIVWAMELAVRRRMIGEVVTPDQVAPAVAFDSLTNSFARVLGPLAGGAAYQTLGLGGAYLLSVTLYLAAGLTVSGLNFRQEARQLRFGRIVIDIAEAVRVARGNPAILTVVLVSIIMNMFAFSYSALIAPIGLDVYRVSPVLVGALAAAEPLGAIAVGIPLSTGWLRLKGRRALLRGSLLFLIGLAAMALSPWYALAFANRWARHRRLLEYADDPDSHRSTAGGAIARDGDRDHVHWHRPGRCGDDRHPLGTSRTSARDPYHGRPRALRIESRLAETDQSVRPPIVMAPTSLHARGQQSRLSFSIVSPLWRSDAVPCGAVLRGRDRLDGAPSPGAFRRIIGPRRKHTRSDRANVVSEGV